MRRAARRGERAARSETPAASASSRTRTSRRRRRDGRHERRDVERVRLLRSHGMTTLTWDRHRGHATLLRRGGGSQLSARRGSRRARARAVGPTPQCYCPACAPLRPLRGAHSRRRRTADRVRPPERSQSISTPSCRRNPSHPMCAAMRSAPSWRRKVCRRASIIRPFIGSPPTRRRPSGRFRRPRDSPTAC